MSDFDSNEEYEFDEDTDSDYCGEDDDVAMDVKNELNRQPSINSGAECLAPIQLIEAQLKAISEVNTIFQISPGKARILLEFFNWDKERLLERYYDDQEKLFKEANVVNPHTDGVHEVCSPAHGHTTCEICFTEQQRTDMTGLDCGHIFCKDCWETYLECKVMEDGTATIRCPALSCSILVDELTITNLISNEAVLKKYQYLVAKNFVRDNRHIKWCPSPGCENAIRVEVAEARPVRCNCNNVFCFNCLEFAHSPIKCKLITRWLKKCADDSETSNWISANTKECPKCKSIIEKNGGCNHMTCRSEKCKYEFCWICLGAWEPHGSSWYNCNRFDEKDAVEARDAQKKSRDSLERYLHYYNRFVNHGNSSKLEKNLSKLVQKKQMELQAAKMSWIEVQFLSKALEVLSDCRDTLKCTYAFAYYLERNNQSEMFESNQKDLEMATETLSGYLEGDAECDDLVKLRQNVMDKTKYCEKRRKALIDHIQEGYDEDWWNYIVDDLS